MGTLCHVFDNKLEEKFTNSPKMDLYRPKLIHFGRNKTITAEIWLFRPKYAVSAETPKHPEKTERVSAEYSAYYSAEYSGRNIIRSNTMLIIR